VYQWKLQNVTAGFSSDRGGTLLEIGWYTQRKFGNQAQVIAQQNAQLLELMAAQQQRQAPPAAPQRSMKDMVYDDTDAFVDTVVARAEQAADRRVEQKVQLSTATQSVVGELSAKYPEFSDARSEAAALAVQKAGRLPAHLKGTPEGAKMVMLEAASELNLIPAPARRPAQQQETDDFALSGSTKGSARTRGNDPKKDIDPLTLAFAQELGIDLTDPKRVEGLKQASQRKNWNRYS
jgi:hypothetical protein